ncbi:MAG: hypothetical protein GY853_15420 [PVC group bacterium]|nr:hypothetical protein [PVC group bacterium]
MYIPKNSVILIDELIITCEEIGKQHTVTAGDDKLNPERIDIIESFLGKTEEFSARWCGCESSDFEYDLQYADGHSLKQYLIFWKVKGAEDFQPTKIDILNDMHKLLIYVEQYNNAFDKTSKHYWIGFLNTVSYCLEHLQSLRIVVVSRLGGEFLRNKDFTVIKVDGQIVRPGGAQIIVLKEIVAAGEDGISSAEILDRTRGANYNYHSLPEIFKIGKAGKLIKKKIYFKKNRNSFKQPLIISNRLPRR